MNPRTLALSCVVVSGCFGSCQRGLAPLDAGTGTGPEEPGLLADDDADAGYHEVAARSASTRLWEAHARGELDQRTVALYHLLSYVAPSQLPPEFAPGEVEPPADFSLIRQALAAYATYTPEQRATLDAFIAPQGDGRFFNFAAGAGMPGCFDAPRGALVTANVVTTRHLDFRVILGVSATDPTPQATADAFATLIASALAVPITNQGLVSGSFALSEYFDRVYEKYVELGFTAPVAAGARVPVYVTNCEGFSEGGFAEPNTRRIFVSHKLSLLDPQLSKVVLPHEIFHLFELDAPDHPNAHYQWPFEAMAVAMEHLVSPGVMRWSGIPAPGTLLPKWFTPMNRRFRCPEEPFHSNNVGVCRRAATPASAFPGRSGVLYAGSYSRFVYFLWLERRAGLSSLRSYWSNFANAGGDPRGTIEDQALADFELALLGDGPPLQSFKPDDRARFTQAGSGLDQPVRARLRYTFAAEAPFLQRGVGHAADTTPGSSVEPTLLDGTDFPLQPGATWRVFVEEPRPGALVAPTASTLVWERTPSAILRAHPAKPDSPTRELVPLELLDLTTTNTFFFLSPSHRQTVMTFTNPPSATSPITSRFGVTSGPECYSQCVAWLQPQVAPCCPESCRGSDSPTCVPECQAATDLHFDMASSMCAELCNADDDPWGSKLAGSGYESYAQKLCMGSTVPACFNASSGLVPFVKQPMSCTQIFNLE
jgi:hypothetical protein